MPYVFLVAVFASLGALVVGLIKPALVTRWGRRSRWTVVGTYLALALVSFGGLAATVPKPDGDPTAARAVQPVSPPAAPPTAVAGPADAPQAGVPPAPSAGVGQASSASSTQSAPAATPRVQPADDRLQELVQSEAARSAWCEYQVGYVELIREFDRLFGLDPEHALQPGEIITAAGELVVGPWPRPADPMANTAALRRMPTGTTFEVRERVLRGRDDVTYVVHLPAQRVTVAVVAGSMPWLQTPDAVSAHVEKRREWTKPREAQLIERALTSRGFDYRETSRAASRADWDRRCRR